MKSKKEFRFLVLLFVATLSVQNAIAASRGAGPYNNCSSISGTGNASNIVDRRVYKCASDLFMETRQISNQNSTKALSFPSVQIWEAVSGWPPSVKSDPVGRYMKWTVTGSHFQTAEFLFADVPGVGEQSLLLDFAGDLKISSGQRYIVPAGYMHDGRFAYTGAAAGSARTAWHGGNMDF